ncbi:MAG: SPOR domain-containing protein [Prolixibacteraceae bacterium]|nr:SPOR domain-containing protein [Prolixibacteraceae bacterium]
MNKHIILNTLLMGFVLVFSLNISVAQSNETLAKELFEDRQYARALPHFEELHRLYPNEAVFQYYYGVCLTETNQFGLKTRKLLLQSAQGKVPSNVFFFIAKNYHADNNFETALQYYERFDDYARNKEKRKVDFKEFYNLCLDGENPFDEIKKEPAAQPVAEKPDNKKTDKTPSQETPANNEEKLEVADMQKTSKPDPKDDMVLSIPKELNNSLINFSVIGNINYLKFDQFKTNEGKIAFLEGDKNSRQLKQTIKTTDSLRNVYKNTTNSEVKKEIAEKVVELELEAIKLKSSADNAFNKARKNEIEYWGPAPEHVLSSLIEENDSIKKAQKVKLTQKESKELHQTIDIKPDSAISQPALTDSTDIKNNGQETPQEEDTEETNNIRYKVQIGAYSKGLPGYVERLYNKLSVLRRIEHYTDDNGIVVYTVGDVGNYDDALQLQKQIRQEGIKDAFVVAYNNGKRITLSEAREIQKND